MTSAAFRAWLQKAGKKQEWKIKLVAYAVMMETKRDAGGVTTGDIDRWATAVQHAMEGLSFETQGPRDSTYMVLSEYKETLGNAAKNGDKFVQLIIDGRLKIGVKVQRAATIETGILYYPVEAPAGGVAIDLISFVEGRKLVGTTKEEADMVQDMIGEALAEDPELRSSVAIVAGAPSSSLGGASSAAGESEGRSDNSKLPGGQVGASVARMRTNVRANLLAFADEDFATKCQERLVKTALTKVNTKVLEVQFSPFIELVEAVAKCQAILQAMVGYYASDNMHLKTQQDSYFVQRRKHLFAIQTHLQNEYRKPLTATLQIQMVLS